MIPSLNQYRACAVIPVYRHVQFVEDVFLRINRAGIYCVVVNDGGDEESTLALRSIFGSRDGVALVEIFPNGGKGKAVHAGFKAALDMGYTHAIQVDADGQHNIEDVKKLLAISEENPLAVVAGVPEYDSSVPKARYYSRYITHVFVWLETLSFSIKDSMCGFRVYPLGRTVDLLNRDVASRMDFDTNIIVRLYWKGIEILSVPTRVTYPDDGVSNFRMWKDNVRISWMHTKLTIGMFIRFPALIARKMHRRSSVGYHD